MARSHYGTVTEAIHELRKQGFTRDFNLEENCIVCHPEKFNPDDFEIVDVYRYEGNTDPADEATVYAIESKSGIKGILVSGYGTSADSMSAAMLSKLRIRK
ncbi:MAG TPA: hypothetical protein VK177_10610 [Flavobacteriales bacterium]|nr:hypothetical protein [Flavobacteriales bacterium]